MLVYIIHPDSDEPKQAYYHLGLHCTVFQAEVFAISQVAKKLLEDNMQEQHIAIMVDS